MSRRVDSHRRYLPRMGVAARLLAAAAVAAVGFAQFATSWHEATVQHVVCAEHGELTHVSSAPCTRPCGRPDGTRSSPRMSGPSTRTSTADSSSRRGNRAPSRAFGRWFARAAAGGSAQPAIPLRARVARSSWPARQRPLLLQPEPLTAARTGGLRPLGVALVVDRVPGSLTVDSTGHLGTFDAPS